MSTPILDRAQQLDRVMHHSGPDASMSGVMKPGADLGKAGKGNASDAQYSPPRRPRAKSQYHSETMTAMSPAALVRQLPIDGQTPPTIASRTNPGKQNG